MEFTPATNPNGTSTFKATASSEFTPAGSPKMTVAQPQSPGLLSRIGTGIQDYANASAATVSPFANALLHPIDTLKKVPSFFTDPLLKAEQQAGEGLYNMVATPGIANKVAGGANLASGLVQSAFAPVTGLFTAASKVPGLKQVADTINAPFTAAGKVGEYLGGKGVDVLPIPQASKDILKKPIQELSSLAAQTMLGGKVIDKVGELTNKGQTITPDLAKNIIEEVKNEPQTPLLQTIEQPKVEVPLLAKPTETSTQPILKPTARNVQTLKTFDGTGEVKVRGLAQNIEAKAIENKLSDNFGDLPEYRTVNMAEQAQHATDLINRDYETAKSIAMGDKAAPKGVIPESVMVAVENKAIKEGDVQTLQDLANSKLVSSATTMGQRIRTLAERDPNSPLGAILDVQKARAEGIAKRGDVTKMTSDAVNQIRESIKRSSPPKESWSSFVDSITC